MSEARRHHVITEAYLRGFTKVGSPGQIVVYDKSSGRIFATSVKNAAVRRDYYRIDSEEVDDPLLLEKSLAKVEGEAMRVLPHLLAGASLTEDERITWSMFMATTYQRGPAARQMVADITAMISLQLAEATMATEGRYKHTLKKMKQEGYQVDNAVSYEEMAEFIRKREFEITISEQFTLLSLVEPAKIAKIFSNMNWSVLMSGPRSYFVTSDNPVVYGSPPETHHPMYGDGGLMNKKVEVTFPLSKQAALLATWKDVAPMFRAPPFLVEATNTRTIGQAYQYVYAPTKDQRVLELARQSKDGARRIRSNDMPAVSVRRRGATT